MLIIKSVLVIVLITLTLTDCINGEYLISGSQLNEACSMSAHLLSSGLEDDQVEKIVVHKLLQLNRKSKPGKKPSLGYAYLAGGGSGPVAQTGTMNFSVSNIIQATISLMNCRIRANCLPVTETCSYINFPDQIDLDNHEHISTLTQQIMFKKIFAHRCNLKLLSSPLRINDQF
ncbi:uncharacterized protein LOC128390719 [Panonychus citri]|uniref:uncharacterized protein LOC128390719 n=1 Tax=Panonychus citri TaxID=50023 RepID=UPI002306E1F5|nr:uncharacterized protein LOC128390719 [Panonychus citri]